MLVSVALTQTCKGNNLLLPEKNIAPDSFGPIRPFCFSVYRSALGLKIIFTTGFSTRAAPGFGAALFVYVYFPDFLLLLVHNQIIRYAYSYG